MRQGGRVLLFMAGLLLPLAPGQGEPSPEYARNLLEGAPLDVDRDADGIPDGWAEIRDPGFRAFPGSLSLLPGGVLHLFLNGRNVGVETISPIPVQAGAAYRLEGFVRSEGLREGSPEALVRWLDGTGRVISVLHRPMTRNRGREAFQVEFGEAPEGAVSAVLGLAALGSEIQATVWFDAPVFTRGPRLALVDLPQGHLLPAGMEASLTLSLGGMDAGRYRLDSRLEDLDGASPWKEVKDLPLPAGSSRLALVLPPLRAGAYRLRVALSPASGGREIAVREMGLGIFSALPGPAGTASDPSSPLAGRPGVWVDPARPGVRELLDVLAPGAMAVRLLPADAAGAPAGWGTRPADLLLRRMFRKGVHCIGMLPSSGGESEVRSAVLRYFGEVEAWALPAGAGEGWDSLLKRWKDIEPWTATLPRASRWGLALAPGSALSAQPGAPFSFALTPEGAQVPEGIEDWSILGPAGVQDAAALRAFAVPTLRSLLSGRSLFLAAEEGGLLDEDGSVLPRFLAWRTFSGMLRDARVLGEIPLSPQAEAWAFRRGGQTCVAAWARRPGDALRIELPSAHPVVVVDLLGRQEILNPVDGRVTLEITQSPRFFLDLSSGWLKTRSTMHLDRSILAAYQPTRADFRLENGFDTSLEGLLILTPPPGWSVHPGTLPVSLPPGGQLTATLSLVPASYEVTAGEVPRLLGARVIFPDPGLAPLEGGVALHLESPALESQAVRHPKGEEVLVVQRVTNHSQAPVFCDAFLSVPGRPEERRPLGLLGPGEVRTVEYRLAAGVLAKGEVLDGVRELEGERRFAIERLP